MKILNSKISVVFFLLTIIYCLTGCKKAAEVTAYQIINNNVKVSDALKEYLTANDPGQLVNLDGTLREVVVYCYIGSDVVRTDELGDISPNGGKSDLIEVESTYEKIKVTFIFTKPGSVYYGTTLNRFHPIAITILEKGKSNIVTIDNTVIITNGN